MKKAKNLECCRKQISSEEVYCIIRNVKLMHYNIFITAVCLLFLIKLKWPKNKSIYDVNHLSNSQVCAVHRFRVICQSVSCHLIGRVFYADAILVDQSDGGR